MEDGLPAETIGIADLCESAFENGLSHVLPQHVRGGEEFVIPDLAGPGCYCIDNQRDTKALLADGEFNGDSH